MNEYEYDVSIVASANRVKFWERFYRSLESNKCRWEVIFVGDTAPITTLPSNFRWIEATVKPAQCYEIGFRAAKGETIHWSADDADYRYANNHDNIDRAWSHYLRFKQQFNDDKTVIAMRPIEDGGDVYDFHHFFGGWHHTPIMAPFALISSRFLNKELGGYDNRFVSGQSENDVIMRVFEAGGRVELCMDCYLYVHHREVHPQAAGENKFRQFYDVDRKFLEDAWVVGGYGAYKDSSSGNKQVSISKTRLLPLQPFIETPDWHFVTQGEKGRW